MNFVRFSTSFTNIFPAANSRNGGQLMSEYNLRSRETVGTHQSIKYEVGPSYVHSPSDFEVRALSDDSGVLISNSTLEILPGRGVINGHFVETLASMSVDLLEANNQLKSQSRSPLKGKLSVGLRVFYATEQTVAGTILVENSEEFYQGIQIVILPEDQLITPIESPNDLSKVTAHIRLANFTFSNNKITGVQNLNESKCQYISADRIANIDMMLSDTYVRKTGLNPKKIYAFAGKGTDPATGYDTWEDVTDSTIIWDANPQRTSVRPSQSQAGFITDSNAVYLALPHKQVEGMVDSSGNPEYYATRAAVLPVADYATNTPGVVNRNYTNYIKDLANKVSEFRSTLTGKQILYLESKDRYTELPEINSAWSIGDYILVGADYTADEAYDTVRPPSTMYVVLPGKVSSTGNRATSKSGLTGACVGFITTTEEPGQHPGDAGYPQFDLSVRGLPNVDYFEVRYNHDNTTTTYYYPVTAAGAREYSNYISVTGEIPLAQETVIGGFLNVPEDTVDGGYVYRDEYGRLRLIDYALLRSGTLAYQISEDLTFPSGLLTEEVQLYMNEYVNQRVAFPAADRLSTSSTPNMINIYVNLSQESSPVTLNIGDIDSRFNTGVYIHFLGQANSNTTINIYDCEKVRIDNDISGSPIINVYRSCLYYDPYVLNYIKTCRPETDSFRGISDLSLWYEAFEDSDPKLVVDNMTVSEIGAPIIPQDIDYWHVTEPNDNHYLTALNSITFGSDGEIVKCGLLLADQSTDNVDPGEKIVVGDFELPQGAGLSYPQACLTKQLKVTGTFVSAYYADSTWYTTNTSFTALTNTYDPYSGSNDITGNIAFHSTTTLVRADIGAESIPCWETDTYHLFYGGAIS